MVIDRIKSLLPRKIKEKTYVFFKPFIVSYYNKGNKVECVVCTTKFRVFRSFGFDMRKNALCSVCGSLERHRLLWSYIHNKSDLFNNKEKKVLHFAPESFFYKLFDNSNFIDYTPCDLYPETYSYTGNTKMTKVDITNIKYDDNTFDFLLCSHVLEHIIDDNKAMTELHRVMKKGGWGIFQVPLDYDKETTYEDFSITAPEEREKAFKQHDHVRIYGKDFKDRLEKAGFRVIADDYVNSFTKDEIHKYSFYNRERIYKCYKD